MRITHLTTNELNGEVAAQADKARGEEDDADAICAHVRSLASAAYRILPRECGRSSAVSPDAIAQVLEQLDQLQRRIGRLQQFHSVRLGELQRWASTLQRLIQEHL